MKKEGNAYTLADLSEPTLGRNYELTVKDCVISVVEWMKSTSNPEMYIQLSRLDLNKVIAGLGAVKYSDWGSRTMLRSSLTASPGAYCYEVDKGIEPRVPTQTRLCERDSNFVYGTQRYYEPRLLAGADVRMKRAYAFIRENHCKGRAF